MTSQQEAQWVLLAQAGDRAAVEALLRSVEPSLARYVRALVGPSHADDIIQDVLFTIYRKLWWLSSPELFRPWMFRIASRTAFRYLKRERRWPDHLRDDGALDDLPGCDTTPASLDVDRLLNDHRLTPTSQAVLVLHFKEGMTLPEVAAVLDVPLGTVKSRLAYGLAALRRRYADGDGGDDD